MNFAQETVDKLQIQSKHKKRYSFNKSTSLPLEIDTNNNNNDDQTTNNHEMELIDDKEVNNEVNEQKAKNDIIQISEEEKEKINKLDVKVDV